MADRLKTSYGNRIVDAIWNMHRKILFEATIEIKGIDRKGILHDVAEIISEQMDINIRKVTVSSDKGIFEGTIELRVHDRDEVNAIMDNLRNIDDLKEVTSL